MTRAPERDELPRHGVAATFSPWLATTPRIQEVLGLGALRVAPCALGDDVDAVLGRVDDPNEATAMDASRRAGVPYYRVYDGWPFRAGIRGPSEPPLSLVVDRMELAGDTPQSRLQARLDGSTGVDPALLERASRARARLLEAGIEAPASPLKPGRRSPDEFYALVYVQGARFFDPEFGSPSDLESALDVALLQRDVYARNAGAIYCVGFRGWKRGFVRAYLRSPHNQVHFVSTARGAVRAGFGPHARLLVWGLRESRRIAALAREHGVPIWRMEDGFLRSVGLGSDLTVPASLVLDRQGIYFDPNTPSDLETILQTTAFDAAERERARVLRELIVRTAISKYNLGGAAVTVARPDHPRVVLVPGQVEDDASILLGTRDVRTNLDLLRAVRRACPDAHVIFKPHPDVTRAGRRGAVPREQALRYADQVLTDVPLPACLSAVDEVHTMTSLVGFEALLRGLRVVCYGLPFYAGWGLTADRHGHPRRTRRLHLDELTAGVLLRYPRYLSVETRLFTTPEVVVRRLREQLERAPAPPAAGWRRELQRVLHVLRGALDVP